MSDPGAPPPLDVAIVGAGIAGLSAAHTLLERGRARGVPIRLAIFDAETRAGGVIQTERIGGFLLEAGPDCFITDKPWALRLCERLGLADDLVGTNPACRRSFVLRGRRLLPIPEGFHLLAPARLLPFATTPTLSLAGRLRAACDLVLPRGPALPRLEQRAERALGARRHADPLHALRAAPRRRDRRQRRLQIGRAHV